MKDKTPESNKNPKHQTLANDHNKNKSWFDKLTQAFLHEPQNKFELLNMLTHAKQRNLLDSYSYNMIEGAIKISESRVSDIMIPRSKMVVLEHNSSFKSVLNTVIQSGHSRFPVMGDNKDEIIGLLLAKDLLPITATSHTNTAFNIKAHLRPAVFIPECKRLDALLQEFRIKRNHLAIVVNEYGGVTGLITIEDVLEQIVGDIKDEYDTKESEYIKKHNSIIGAYIVSAITPIAEFNKFFNATFDDIEAETIGGIVMRKCNRVPKVGEIITLQDFNCKILNADTRRIHFMLISKIETN